MLKPQRDGIGKSETEDGANAGEQEAFREQLADDAAAAGAERAAH